MIAMLAEGAQKQPEIIELIDFQSNLVLSNPELTLPSLKLGGEKEVNKRTQKGIIISQGE